MAEATTEIIRGLRKEYPDEVKETTDVDLEIQVSDLLDRLGVAKKLDRLEGERKELVVNGIVSLWIINSLGQKVESDDLEIIGDEIAGKKIDEIQMDHHGKPDWFDDSVIGLVNAAFDPVTETQSVLKNRVVDLPARYINKLDMASQVYSQALGTIGSETSYELKNYIEDVRPNHITLMQNYLNGALALAVRSLTPFVPDEE